MKLMFQYWKQYWEVLGTNLLFDGCYYGQLDGSAIGSPIDRVLADNFTGFYKSNWVKEFFL